jgi:spore maturation protein CgeB
VNAREIIAIVGAFDGPHLGSSFSRAGADLGLTPVCFDLAEAFATGRIRRSLSWRLCDHRPPLLATFSARVAEQCQKIRPAFLLSTGTAGPERQDLEAIRRLGTVMMNYSCDDPWNQNLASKWHFDSLPAYDLVFTTRRANMDDLRRLGCADVRYLPFGYDPEVFNSPANAEENGAPDVLFVGAGDRDRAGFMSEFARSGSRLALVGDYWDRFPRLRQYALGKKLPREICALTAVAKVNLCLVRRANRDGHVMRSFEIPAIGGCMLAEDTAEHRDIFGVDGECVRYFRNARDAAEIARRLIEATAERWRMTAALRDRVANEDNTYRARLAAMLHAATALQAISPSEQLPAI